MLNKLNLSKDIQKYCLSYLSENEIFYSNGEWSKFPRNNICRIAAQNGWLDLLKWARKNGCDWDSYTCNYAAENGHLEILKWARDSLASSEMVVIGILIHVVMPLEMDIMKY